MVRKQVRCSWLLLVLAVLAVGVLVGCAAKRPAPARPEDGVILRYRMEKGSSLKYETTQDVTQNMEMMGQTTQVEITKAMAFSIEPKGLKEDNHNLTVTIESMDAGVVTPMGEFEADVESAIGKSFNMIVSPLGDEIDVAGAGSIEYSVGPAETRSIRSDFEAFFPDVPAGTVKIGDTWTSKDTLNFDEDNMDISVISDNVNTLEAVETVNGLECVRISVEVKGEVRGEGQQQGADVTFEGQMEGNETWFFAYGEGLLVKTISDLQTEGSAAVTGPMEMTIPMTQQIKTETSLIQ